ncbi:UNVERIFIED_CONTAM: hypothetical protein K2H54_046109 [Gekko kuhli]
MFRFNHPKEAAKLREKRKSGLLSSFSLSMSDLSKSCENLSAVMLYNPGLEFERQQREELEKLESKRKLIEEMEERQKSDKAELERMQQEVESQRKETEIVQLQIRKQEENLKRRSFHIESRMKDLLAEKEKFEEERLREQQEMESQKKKQQEEVFVRVKEELQRLQELGQNEKAEKMQIFRELEKLKKEKEEQYLKLEMEKKRLEEQEREQVMLVSHLEEQLRDKQVMIQVLKRGDMQRVEEEKKDLEDIRESLLRVKEARSEGDEDCEELEKAQQKFMDFKRKQLEQLVGLERDLVQQKDHLEKEVADEHELSGRLKHVQHTNLERHNEKAANVDEGSKIKSEYWLQQRQQQLRHLTDHDLPALLEEKQRASEVLDRGLQSLDNTLYEVEKEMEEKEEQLTQYRASASQLQQLQETFEFTANVARQEEKVRKKEKEILASRQKQQREALEQAVAKLERRHSALQQSSTLDIEIEEQKQKLAVLNSSCDEQAGLQATIEAEQKALEQDRERLDLQIQQLKQKICEGDGAERGHLGGGEEKQPLSGSSPNATKSPPHFIPSVDDRINAFIEEEVQRRLQNVHYPSAENNNSLFQSMESLKARHIDNEKFKNGTVQRKLKYEGSFCFFLSRGERGNPVAQAHADGPSQCERVAGAPQSCPPVSDARTQPSYGLGHLYSKFASVYRDASSQIKSGRAFQHLQDLVGFRDRNEKCTQAVSLIKSFPFVRKLQLNMFVGGRGSSSPLMDEVVTVGSDDSPGCLVRHEDAIELVYSEAAFNACGTVHSKPSSIYGENEDGKARLVPKQNFIYFSDWFLQLQLRPLDELLQYVACVLPEMYAKPEELRGVYWIAVGNRENPFPKPACLFLLSSAVYAIVPSASRLESGQDSLEIFHAFPVTALREIQIGYAGQSVRLLSSSEDNAMTIFTFNQSFTQRLCLDILSTVVLFPDYACLDHKLLKGDLLQLSLDWTSKVSDLVLDNGVRLTCNFEGRLADLVYLLHENMGTSKPPLGDVQILFYTTVKLEGEFRSLVLTNTHIGLVQDDSMLYPTRYLHCIPENFNRIQLHDLSELWCLVIPEKTNPTEIELVFSNTVKESYDSDSSLSCAFQTTKPSSVVSFSHAPTNTPSCIWKLTFSSDEDAFRLMVHLMGR